MQGPSNRKQTAIILLHTKSHVEIDSAADSAKKVWERNRLALEKMRNSKDLSGDLHQGGVSAMLGLLCVLHGDESFLQDSAWRHILIPQAKQQTRQPIHAGINDRSLLSELQRYKLTYLNKTQKRISSLLAKQCFPRCNFYHTPLAPTFPSVQRKCDFSRST